MTTRPQRTVQILLAFAVSTPLAAMAAQTRPAQAAVRVEQPVPNATAPITIDENARETRDRLRELLDQYPPSLAQVLRLDPSLLARVDYVAPYPRLAAFLAQHPEVAHNPGYFIGDARFGGPPDTRNRAMNLLEDVLGGIAGLTVFGTIVGFLVWVIRSLISYRSWQHIVKIQTEAHTKIFDRLTGNEELLTYIQSPAGQRFLTSTSTAVDLSPRSIGAPVGRILWSVQVGVVIAFAGIGLFVARNIMMEEVAQVLYVLSILAMSLGLGFVVSALVAYFLSQRLGLVEARTTHA
jgi:hypothetical protein